MKRPWMPLYVGDYLADTTHLTQGQHGAYMLLILHYWQRGGLPSKEQCYCIAHAMDEHCRSNVDAVLLQFFIPEGDHYRHTRIEKELKKTTEAYNRRVSAAKARWSIEEPEQCMSNADALHEQPQPQPQPHSEPESKKTKTSARIHFALPSLGEISAYCQERGNKVDPQVFFDHYTANGWLVGRNHMKDWRAAVRTWEKNAFNPAQRKESLAERNQRAFEEMERRAKHDDADVQ